MNNFEKLTKRESKDYRMGGFLTKFNQHVQESYHKLNEMRMIYQSGDHSSLIASWEGAKVTDFKKFKIMLSEAMDNISPFIYLSTEQRKNLLKEIDYVHYDQKVLLYNDKKETPGHEFCAYILLQGEAHFLGHKSQLMDLITDICLFGYDGPIFKKRTGTVILEKNTVVGVIKCSTFLRNIIPFSRFSTFLSNTIIHKDKILNPLNKFKEFVLSHIDKGPINIDELLSLYRKINPCLHPKANSDFEVDFSAWNYALNRLPDNIIHSFVFILINKPPKLFCTREQLVAEKMPYIKTKARMRDVYKYIDGKDMVICREMETDVLDFVTNMCIHLIESSKMRRVVNSPLVVEKLFDYRNSYEKCVNVLKNQCNIEMTDENFKAFNKIFGNKFADVLIDMCLHYQDYYLSIIKLPVNDHNPVESWTQNLWQKARKLLNVSSNIDEVDDLVVDMFQGSKRTLLGVVTPHLFKYQDEILTWGKENNIQLKTKTFNTKADMVIAYAFYWYKAFPERMKEREAMEKDHGIIIVEETFSTGVQVLLVNVNKLNREFIDPAIDLQPASKNHLILHIGYTFGAQAGHIIRPLLMLFGSKARSFNIIGKAGGLTGNRTDILVADRIFYDKTHEIININTGKMCEKVLAEEIKCPVHIGPFITVAGTILQNNDLLYFYQQVRGCIGLEMESFFYAKEIEIAVKHGLVRSDFVTRMFYYSSDLPLDPTQNLAMEEGNVNWDEGVCSMNAIQRYMFKQIISA
jgi:hypothetical protein